MYSSQDQEIMEQVMHQYTFMDIFVNRATLDAQRERRFEYGQSIAPQMSGTIGTSLNVTIPAPSHLKA